MNKKQNQQVVYGSGSEECPVCRGTGVEVYEVEFEEYPVPLSYGRYCPSCNRLWRAKDKTNIPPQFHDADLHKFGFDSYSMDMGRLKTLAWNFLNKFPEWQKSGKGLYLWSETPGSGKTFLASSIGKSVMMKHDLQMRFVTVPDYLAKVGESYKREMGTSDESRVYRECDLLILDDMGVQKSGDWQKQEIFRIINERLNAGKVTIFTSNMPPESLNLDSRTIDRIRKVSVVIQMPEESIRLKKAQEEQEEFLAKMLS